jgi:hypothetical protein
VRPAGVILLDSADEDLIIPGACRLRDRGEIDGVLINLLGHDMERPLKVA